jgi:colanic acid/amylovoran biosynthesis glycosyltransferase
VTLAIISSRFPNTRSETFLGVELKGLQPHFDRVIVVPARESLFDGTTLREALRAALARPKRFFAVLRILVLGAGRPSILAKNLAILPRALAVSRILEREGVDHVHAYWLSTPATVALVASQMTGLPWSSSAHRWDIYENNLLRQKGRSARFLRTISDRGRRDLGRALTPQDAGKVTQVKVGVEMPQIARKDEPGRFAMLCAANLIEQKGHADLLEALAILAARGVAFRCDVAGSGPLYGALERRIAELGLSQHVALQGRVPHARLLERLARGEYDVAVLASRSDGRARMEGIPVALMEAMAAGVPCVATNSGSIPELIDDRCGAVVPAGDALALAAALERLGARRELRRQLGANARVRIAEHFNIERTGPQLARLIQAS